MKANDLSQFTFTPISYGAYAVTYTTKRGDYYVARIEDITLIDDTRGRRICEQKVKVSSLKALRNEVKRNGMHFHSDGTNF